MRQYLYETHMHTAPVSACGRSLGRDYISRYIDMGYDGIIITDHFFRGNSGIDRSLPWAERIRQFCQGYEDAKNEGDKRNFPVFFGYEENFRGDEYLVYGVDGKWMMEHPEMEHWTHLEQYQAIHAAGGCIVQAHPFRQRAYLSSIQLCLGCMDGIEGINTQNEASWNGLALRYAQQLNLPVTAGSDNHFAPGMTKQNLSGVLLPEPLTCIEDYVKVILERKPMQIYAPATSATPMDLSEIKLPVEIRNANEEVVRGDIRNFLLNGTF